MGLTAQEQAEYDALTAEDARRSSQEPNALGQKVATWRFPAEQPIPADTRPGQSIDANTAANQSMPILGGGVPAAVQTPPAAPAQQPPNAAAPPVVLPEDRAEWAALNAEVTKRAEKGGEPGESKPEKDKAPGFWERTWPTKEEKDGGYLNPDLEKYSDWTGAIPLGWGHGDQAARMILGTAIANPEEAFDIFKEQLPGATIEKAGKYNQYIKIQPAGSDQVYTWKPGIRASDFARAAVAAPVAAGGAALTAAMLPVGAPAILGALGGGAALELQKWNAGGGFNPGNVAATGIMHGVMDGVGALDRAASGTAIPAIPPSAAADVPRMTAAELGPQLAAAGRGNETAQAAVTSQVSPSADLTEAAKTLTRPDGQPLIESLAPAHLSQNPVYQSLTNAAAGADATHAEALRGLGGALTRAIEGVGGEVNQGAVEREVAEEIKERLKIASRIATEKNHEVFGHHEVGGLFPGSSKVPLPRFQEYLKNMQENRYGHLPPEVEQIRADLQKGVPWEAQVTTPKSQAATELEAMAKTPVLEQDLSRKLTLQRQVDLERMERLRSRARLPPTQSMVESVRRKLDAGGYREVNSGLQKELAKILKEEQYAAAEAVGGGIGDKAREAKNAWRANSLMHEAAESALGEGLTKSLTDKVSAAVKDLPHGSEREFVDLLRAAPDYMRSRLAKYALAQFVTQEGDISAKALNGWFKAMQGNKQSWNALKSYVGGDLADNLERVAKITKNVTDAMDAVKPRDIKGTFSEPFNVPGLVYKMLRIATVAKLTTPLGAAGYTLAEQLLTKPSPVTDAMGEYLSSPIAREFMSAQIKGQVPEALFRANLNSPAFRRVMVAANLGPHAAAELLRGAAQQPDKAAQ